MAVEVHIAELGLMHVDGRGQVYQRGNTNLPVKGVLSFTTEHRVVVDNNLATTSGNPTIKTYLEREAANDFEPVQIFQSFVITKKTT